MAKRRPKWSVFNSNKSGRKMNDKQPWLDEPDFMEFEHCGLKCKILRVITMGHLCGYVGIPETHKHYKKGYDDLNRIDELQVHGGLTFSNKMNDEDGLWYFGFDAAHRFDLMPLISRRLFRPSIESQEYRDMSYMKKECEKLAEFLAKVEK